MIFLASALAAGGLYAQRLYLERQIASMVDDLETVRAEFDPTLIAQLEQLDLQFNTARALLAKHIAPSVIFTLIEQSTYRPLRYTTLALAANDDGSMNLTVGGEARSFEIVALQSDAFNSNSNLERPIASDLDVLEKGLVSFSIATRVRAPFVSFQSQIAAAAPPPVQQESPSSPAPVGGASPAVSIPPASANQNIPTAQPVDIFDVLPPRPGS